MPRCEIEGQRGTDLKLTPREQAVIGQRNRLRSNARGRYERRAEAKAGRDTGSVALAARCGPHGRLEEKAQRATSCTEALEAKDPGVIEAEPEAGRLPRTFPHTTPLQRNPSKGNLLISGEMRHRVQN